MDKNWGVIHCTDGCHVWDHVGCEIVLGKGNKWRTIAQRLTNYLNRNNISGKFHDIEDFVVIGKR